MTMFLKTTAKIVLTLAMLLGVALPARAFSDQLEISNLPEYTRTNDIEISFTALSEGSVNVHFCYRKEGEGFKKFGPTFTTPSGEVQVTSSQMNDQMVRYYFKAALNGADCSGSATDETSTIYDYSGPSPVSNLKKENKGNGYWKLSWKNPHDPDFSRVFIYRSESSTFTANGQTKVGETGGAYNAEVSWDNYGLDVNKKYYYAVRAVDKAGNPSSVVGDSETVTVLGVVAPTAFPEEKVVIVPSVTGQILADSIESQDVVEPTITKVPPTPTQVPEKSLLEKVKTSGNTKTILFLLLGLGVVSLIYSFVKKNQS